MRLPSTESIWSAIADWIVQHTPRWARVPIVWFLLIIWLAGSPAALMSFLSDREWVIDLALWCYRAAGSFQPFLLKVAELISNIVTGWRLLAGGFWSTLLGWTQIALPPWAVDLLSILLLLLLAVLRRAVLVQRAVREAAQDTEDVHRKIDETMSRAADGQEIKPETAGALGEVLKRLATKHHAKTWWERRRGALLYFLAPAIYLLAVLIDWIYLAIFHVRSG